MSEPNPQQQQQQKQQQQGKSSPGMVLTLPVNMTDINKPSALAELGTMCLGTFGACVIIRWIIKPVAKWFFGVGEADSKAAAFDAKTAANDVVSTIKREDFPKGSRKWVATQTYEAMSPEDQGKFREYLEKKTSSEVKND